MTTQNRFLSYGNTSELARESTLTSLVNTVDNGIEVSLPPNGNNVNVATITGTTVETGQGSSATLNAVQRVAIVNDQETNNWGELKTDLNEIDGFAITTGITASANGTQAISIVTDQPAIDQNLTQINGSAVATNTGNASATTQRVVIASDQPTLPISITSADVTIKDIDFTTTQTDNLGTDIKSVNGTIIGGSSLPTTITNSNVPSNITQVKGTAISTGKASADAGTIRVVLADDQNTSNWDQVPVDATGTVQVLNADSPNNILDVEVTNGVGNAVFTTVTNNVPIINATAPNNILTVNQTDSGVRTRTYINDCLRLNGSGSFSITPATASVQRYYFQPTGDCFIQRLLIYIEDTGGFRADAYGKGGNGALSPGLDFYYKRGSDPDVLINQCYKITRNAIYSSLCYDVEYLDFGGGNNMLAVRWTFAKGIPGGIFLESGDQIGCITNEVINNLFAHYMVVQGYYT